MKVNLYQTVEVSDEQRVALAVVLDDGRTKPKRQATRDEIKQFIWSQGEDWEHALAAHYGLATGAVTADSFDVQQNDDGITAADEAAALLGDEQDESGTDEDLLGDGDDDLLGTDEDDEDLLG